MGTFGRAFKLHHLPRGLIIVESAFTHRRHFRNSRITVIDARPRPIREETPTRFGRGFSKRRRRTCSWEIIPGAVAFALSKFRRCFFPQPRQPRVFHVKRTEVNRRRGHLIFKSPTTPTRFVAGARPRLIVNCARCTDAPDNH